MVCTDNVPASDFIQYKVRGDAIDPPTQSDTKFSYIQWRSQEMFNGRACIYRAIVSLRAAEGIWGHAPP